MEDEEWFPRYHPGGWHPVHLGEVYKDGRYEIVYKLGAGSRATVWLAKDHELGRYVALKFAAADAKHIYDEETILRFLTEKKHDPNVAHEGKQYIIELYDAFTSKSTNGEHRVLVTNVVRPLLGFHTVDEDAFGLPGRQLVEAVDFLHSNGIVHLDLHICNVGLAIDFTDDDFAKLEPPQPNDGLDTRDNFDWNEHMPRALWNFSDWEEWSPLPEPATAALRIQVYDFDDATSPFRNETRTTTGYNHYPPPELRLAEEDSLSPALDIWSMGCLLIHWERERNFFDEYPTNTEGDYVRRLLRIEDSLPERWRALGDKAMALHPRRSDQEDSKFVWSGTRRCRCRAKELPQAAEEAAKKRHCEALNDFFCRAATLDPERRPSAAELRKHPYVNHIKTGDLAPKAGHEVSSAQAE